MSLGSRWCRLPLMGRRKEPRFCFDYATFRRESLTGRQAPIRRPPVCACPAAVARRLPGRTLLTPMSSRTAWRYQGAASKVRICQQQSATLSGIVPCPQRGQHNAQAMSSWREGGRRGKPKIARHGPAAKAGVREWREPGRVVCCMRYVMHLFPARSPFPYPPVWPCALQRRRRRGGVVRV